MKLKIGIIVIAIFLAICITIGNCVSKKEKIISYNYFKGLNLELTGIVYKINKLCCHNALIYLTISKTNISDYDPSDSVKYFYCLIKNDKAVLVDGPADYIKMSDSISVSSKNNRISIFRKKKLINKYPLFLSEDYEAKELKEKIKW